MNGASKSKTSSLLGTAANADRLGEHAPSHGDTVAQSLPATGIGWDAYDVWRRFIKEARERRQQQE